MPYGRSFGGGGKRLHIYALRDETNEDAGILAFLECYERPRSFFFELPPHADPWSLPFILHEFAQRGQHTVSADWSLRWVQSRLVPPERQNLGEVLRVNGLSEYDELRLLELTEGRCAQDGCYLVPTGSKDVPGWYTERVRDRLTDAFALSGFRLLLAFGGGKTSIVCARELLADRRPFARVISDEGIFARMALQAGGHGVQWGSSLHASAEELREAGRPLELRTRDLAALIPQALCDTAQAAQILGCTKQNISDLVRRGKLDPIKSGPRLTLFLRSDVLARR